MKQASYPKRSRGRSFERRTQKNSYRESGSEGKSRNNNFQQAVDKYLTLAREAASSGDPISAENYYQYADHYYRLAFAHRSSRSSEKQQTESVPEVPSPVSLNSVSTEPSSGNSLEAKDLV